MQSKYLLAAAFVLFLTGCNENSDGSDKTTYSSCSITDSQAIFAGDRANDVAQCWDGVDYKEKSTAQSWCAEKVSTYISTRYTFGHSVEYQVASTNCPG